MSTVIAGTVVSRAFIATAIVTTTVGPRAVVTPAVITPAVITAAIVTSSVGPVPAGEAGAAFGPVAVRARYAGTAPGAGEPAPAVPTTVLPVVIAAGLRASVAPPGRVSTVVAPIRSTVPGAPGGAARGTSPVLPPGPTTTLGTLATVAPVVSRTRGRPTAASALRGATAAPLAVRRPTIVRAPARVAPRPVPGTPAVAAAAGTV
ncbi:MAG: hypothetical protein L0I76_31920 [Pseudonocardia sp.]|nr:hypothetical protein [Pseudonocardia sp.]